MKVSATWLHGNELPPGALSQEKKYMITLIRKAVDMGVNLFDTADTLAAFGNQRGLTPAQVALAWLLALKPFVVPIPGTTKLAHLLENLWSADFEFAPDELKKLTEDLSKIKIVGDRYMGAQAEQTKK